MNVFILQQCDFFVSNLTAVVEEKMFWSLILMEVSSRQLDQVDTFEKSKLKIPSIFKHNRKKISAPFNSYLGVFDPFSSATHVLSQNSQEYQHPVSSLLWMYISIDMFSFGTIARLLRMRHRTRKLPSLNSCVE